jgi:L-lactate dehydrogenase (cytochrome)
VLEDIVAAVDGACEVMFDGGIRSGQDIAKALALGARGTLIGKAFLFALAGAGEAGVTKCLEIMRNELKVTLALTGTTNARSVGRQILR